MDIKDKINHAYEQRQYINHYIMLSDTKMAIFIALNTVLMGNIISNFQYESGIFKIIMQIIPLVLLVMAIILSFSVLIPRTYNTYDKSYIDNTKHIYNINNYKIQLCSILPIFLIETINLVKSICFINIKYDFDKQPENQYHHFAISWVSMYQSPQTTLVIPDNMSEEDFLIKLNSLNNILAGICATKNALSKVSIVLSIYSSLFLLICKLLLLI